MPIVICSYCLYVGSGLTYEATVLDVIKHEKTCSERTEECSKCGSPEIYQQWKVGNKGNETKLCRLCYEDLAEEARLMTEPENDE